ncbi:MAG: tetratricopeptide repeat protein, partial [Chloroflexota bacterium]|nr:tetratricopeptide repeat protein [Chloroflexota bacterium]
LEASTPHELAAVFFDQVLAPFLAEYRTLLVELADFEQHLRRHLLDRTLVHLGELLKARAPAWRAFNRLVLEELREEVQQIGAGQAEVVARLDELLDPSDTPQLAEWSDGLADLLAASGRIEKRVGEGFDVLLQRVGTQHREVLAHFAVLLSATGRIEDKVDQILRHLENGARMVDAPPPVPVAQGPPSNLPLPATPFIGREREVAEATALLRRAEVRLLTLTGPGGIGKTRLGLEVAAHLRDDFPDGVFFVSLAPIRNPALVASTITQVLGVREASSQPQMEHLQAYLQDKQVLLVLDNFEQVLEAAPLVAELLGSAPQLEVLVTSRAPLRLAAEREYPVPPLTVPDPKRLPELASLSQYEAVALFIERAQAVKPDFQVTNTNAPAVAEICARLDGLPLAIELAAARSKLLPPQAMLARLSRRLKLLIGGARDLPARQQTLRRTIDWSYSLLEAPEQTLFARLAVFVGGRTLEAIEAVCNADGDLATDPFEGVASLLDKSLLQQAAGPEGEPRFVMLETIHEYAWERLQARGEADVLRQRHAEYFLALAERAEPELTGPLLGAWLLRLEAEHGNLRTALQWVLETGAVELALRLGGALWRFWDWRGHWREGRRWLEAVLERGNALPATLRVKAVLGAGSFALNQCDYGRAQALLEESLALFRELGDTRGTGSTLNLLGQQATMQGDYGRAQVLFEESLALFRELGDKERISVVLNNLGVAADDQGDYATARACYEESLALAEEVGDTYGVLSVLVNLGLTTLNQHDFAGAKLRFQKTLVQAREKRGAEVGIAYCLEGLAAVAGALATAPEHGAWAAWLFGAAEVLRERLGSPLYAAERAKYEEHVAAARAQLGEAAWEAAWAEGRAMPLEQAIAYALEEAASA